MRTPLTTALICLTAASAAPAQDQISEHSRKGKELRLLSSDLAEAAKRALEAKSFEARNRIHAEAVTAESAELASRALWANGAWERAALRRTFSAAVTEAGNEFRGAFKADGSYRPEAEAVKKKAQSAAGEIARAYTPALIAAIEGRAVPSPADMTRAESILDRARIEDVARIMNPEATGRIRETLDAESIRYHAKRLVPEGDWSRGMLDSMPARKAGEKPLTPSELRVLEGSIRLANATWKSGQVHRAVAENDPGRVSIKRAGNYAPFDLMQREVFNRSSRAAFEVSLPHAEPIELARSELPVRVESTAFSRTLFEVYKDLAEVNKGKLESPEARVERLRSTQSAMARAYGAELRSMSIPRLRAEARRRGVSLPEGRLSRTALAKHIWKASLPERAKSLPASAPRPGRKGAAERLAELTSPRSSGRRVRGR